MAGVARGRLSSTSRKPGTVRRETTTHGLSAEQISRIRRRILKWGRANFREYPWRTERDPWLSFLAELLLQRTRASQVEPTFSAIRQRFPTAASLATGGLKATRDLTGRLGLHSRGPLILRIAKAVADRGGVPPDTAQELQALAGVGMYTAGAWLSLHAGKRAVIIDANIARWLSRMTGLPYNRDPRHVRWAKGLADRLTPRVAFRDYNYAVLDFTIGVCTPRNPHCEVCTLRSDCRYGAATALSRAPDSPKSDRRTRAGRVNAGNRSRSEAWQAAAAEPRRT